MDKENEMPLKTPHKRESTFSTNGSNQAIDSAISRRRVNRGPLCDITPQTEKKSKSSLNKVNE